MGLASDNLTMGQMNAIVKKLGGMDGVHRLLSGVLMIILPSPSAWKRVKIGVHKNPDTMIGALKEFRVDDGAKRRMSQSELAQTEEDINLCKLTVYELTGRSWATTTEIFDTIKRIGNLCLVEDGFALREQYLNQRYDERLNIVIEPPTWHCSWREKWEDILFVGHGQFGFWLGSDSCSTTKIWESNESFVFRARK